MSSLCRGAYAVLLVLSGAAVVGRAQAPPMRVETDTALKQLIKRVEPAFPQSALAENPGAPFAVDLLVREDGTVESVTVVVGPEPLRAAAVTALRQWTFKPFMNGARPVRAMVLVPIALPDPVRDAERNSVAAFMEAEVACTRSVAARDPDAVSVCQQPVRISDRLPPDRHLERSHAHSGLGWAFLQANRLAEALPEFELALQIRRPNVPDDDADDADVMFVMATIQARLGRPRQADDLFRQSVEAFERAMVAVPSLRALYVERYARTLRGYADFKRANGADAEARALEARLDGVKRPNLGLPMPAPVHIGKFLYLRQAAPTLTDDDVRQISALLPPSPPAWLLQTSGDMIEPGHRWSARAYLQPGVVRPGFRRGRIVSLSAAIPSDDNYAAVKTWHTEKFDVEFAQVFPPASVPTQIRGSDDPNRPFEVSGVGGSSSVPDADITNVVRFLRESATPGTTDPMRLYLDVQAWPIDRMTFWPDGHVDVTLREGVKIDGPGQLITVKRSASGWTLAEIRPLGAR